MSAASLQYAREVIHAFNEKGFAALDQKWSGGRPRRFGPCGRELVCRVAKTPPQRVGCPFTTWSLFRLVSTSPPGTGSGCGTGSSSPRGQDS